MKWTDLERSIVLQGIADGLTGSQIAVQLPGRTRNAVIGYIDRQGLTLMRSPGKPRKVRKPKKRTARKPIGQTGKVLPMPVLLQKSEVQPEPVALPEDEYNRDALRLSVMDLQSLHCRWPVNEPAWGQEYEFCGKVAADGRSYCSHHRALAYRGYSRLEKVPHE